MHRFEGAQECQVRLILGYDIAVAHQGFSPPHSTFASFGKWQWAGPDLIASDLIISDLCWPDVAKSGFVILSAGTILTPSEKTLCGPGFQNVLITSERMFWSSGDCFLLLFHIPGRGSLAVILRSTGWTLAGCGHRPAAPCQWLLWSHSCVSQTTWCQWNSAVRHWFLPLCLWMLLPCHHFCFFLQFGFCICFQPKLRNLPARIIWHLLGKLQGGGKISRTTSKHNNWASRPLHWTI